MKKILKWIAVLIGIILIGACVSAVDRDDLPGAQAPAASGPLLPTPYPLTEQIPSGISLGANESLSVSTQTIERVQVNNATGQVTEKVSIPIQIVNLTDGLSGLVAHVKIEDESIASLHGIRFPNYGLIDISNKLPWHETDLTFVDLTGVISGDATIFTMATLEVLLIGEGTTTITLTIDRIDSDTGQPIIIDTFTPGIITVISATPATRNKITVPPSVEKQLRVWQADFLVNRPRTAFDRGQVKAYDAIIEYIDTGFIDPSRWDKETTDALTEVVRSYYVGLRHEYEATRGDSTTTVTRSSMRDYLNMFIGLTTEPTVIRTASVEAIPTSQGRGRGNTQYALPNANHTNTGPWVEGAGDGDGDYWDELDEGFGAGRGSGSGPDDLTSYWISANNPSFQRLHASFATIDDPQVSTGQIYRTRARKGGGARQLDIQVFLKEGLGTIASVQYLNINTTWTTRSVTLTGTEADSITLFDQLGLYVNPNTVGGGSPTTAEVSAYEFETPDAPVAPAIDSFGNIH